MCDLPRFFPTADFLLTPFLPPGHDTEGFGARLDLTEPDTVKPLSHAPSRAAPTVSFWIPHIMEQPPPHAKHA